MAYDRTKAVKYADDHWNQPCHDGVVWLTNGAISIKSKRSELKAPETEWDARFVDDNPKPEKLVFKHKATGAEKVIQGWDGLADCAHFLSQCLTAGGAAVNERGVRELVQAVQARNDTKTLCERVTKEAAQRVIDFGVLAPGDIIGYFNISSSGDFGGARAYTHSTMYVGAFSPGAPAAKEHRVTCHTVARYPLRSWFSDVWSLKDNTYNYTFVHFTTGDAAPGPMGAALEGWWKLVYSGRTEYYYILKDGRARYTLRAPKSARETIPAGDGSAYWFADGSKVKFIWRKTGTIETWSPGPNARQFSSQINNAIPGVVTRVF